MQSSPVVRSLAQRGLEVKQEEHVEILSSKKKKRPTEDWEEVDLD